MQSNNEQLKIPVEYQNALSIEPVKDLHNQINNIFQPYFFKEDESYNLSPKEKLTLKMLINRNFNLFFTDGEKLSFTHEIKHGIIMKHNNPFCSKVYRYPKIQEIEKQIKEMLEQGIIRNSNSPYNSPLWIVPKKADNSGQKKWRIVYRKINEETTDDKFPIPNIESILEKLGRAQYFSTLL